MARHLNQRIEEHHHAIGALASRVDAILAAAEELTREARETLGEYQRAKRHAGEVLGIVGARYAAAQHHLGKADALLDDLDKIRADHVSLTYDVNRLLTDGHASGPQQCERLADARRDLRAVYARIQQAHADAGLDDEDDEVPGPD